MPDYKTPPKREVPGKKTILIILGLVVILGLGYLIMSGRFKPVNNGGKSSSDLQADQQQKEAQRQQAFTQMLTQNGYTAALPQDLILDPQSHATTTVTTNKKTGVTTTSVVYVENRPFSQVLDIYPIALKQLGWTVAPPDPKKPSELNVSKNGFSAVITVAPSGLASTQVKIQFTTTK